MTWNEPVSKVCPHCGKTLFKKKGKQSGLLCLTEGCAFRDGDTGADTASDNT